MKAKQYITPDMKAIELGTKCLGPGAGDVSNPTVGNAATTEFDTEEEYDSETPTTVWDSEE